MTVVKIQSSYSSDDLVNELWLKVFHEPGVIFANYKPDGDIQTGIFE